MTPHARIVSRLALAAAVCGAGLVIAAPHAGAAAAAPAITVQVTDVTVSGGPIRAGHTLRYDLQWSTNDSAFRDAWVDVELDGTQGTALLDQVVAGDGGTVSTSTSSAGTLRSLTWDLGHQARNAAGRVAWTAVVSGVPTDGVPAICTGGTLRGPLGGGGPVALAAPACTTPSTACAGAPALTLGGPATVTPRARSTYTLSLQNTGALTMAAVGLQLPAGFTLASSSPATTTEGGLPTFVLGALGAGQQVTATFDAVAPATPGAATIQVRLVGIPLDGTCPPPNVAAGHGVAVVAAGVQGVHTGGGTSGTTAHGSGSTVAPVASSAPVGVVATPDTGVSPLGGAGGVVLLLLGAGLVTASRRRPATR